jgi:hypothetical protein
VPADRVRALEQAFARTMADPEFLADAERSQIVIAPVTSDAIRQRVLEFLAIPPDIREKLRPIMFPV